jgi:hypothetical protein
VTEVKKGNIAEAMNTFFNRPQKVTIKRENSEDVLEFYVKPAEPNIQKEYSKKLTDNPDDTDMAVKYVITELICDEEGNKVFNTPEDIKLTIEFRSRILSEIADKGFNFKLSEVAAGNFPSTPSSEAVSQ